MYKLLCPFLFIPFLIACSGEKKEVKIPEKLPDSLSRSERPVKVVSDEPVAYDRLDSSIQKYIVQLDSLFDKTPYYTKVNDQYIFYVCKGKWDRPSNGIFKNEEALMGVADQDLNIMLRPAYTKIYNPDATVHGYIEIEYKGKKGLFNYTDGKIIEPQFDLIFPSDNPSYVAFGKTGNDHYGITPVSKEKYSGEIPTYIALGEKWNFDIKSKNLTLLYDSYHIYYAGDPNQGRGVVLTPSYFYHLGFIPEIVEDISTADDVDFGVTSSEGHIVKTISITDKIFALITSFNEEGVDVRGWTINKNNLITVDSRNNVIGNQTFLTGPNIGYGPLCGGDGSGFHFLEGNLLEVFEVVNSSYSKYDYMTGYSYYKIKENGEIENMKSNRVFDFTKFVVMDDSYFKGCFSKHRSADEMYDDDDDEVGNMWLYDHLTLEDLDLMRNEIYAEYGLKFKTEKWQLYFSQKPWYKPAYDNVDQFLSNIDKQNIKLILLEKQKMAGKEDQITNKRIIGYAPPG
jgi:hypothetical protein